MFDQGDFAKIKFKLILRTNLDDFKANFRLCISLARNVCTKFKKRGKFDTMNEFLCSTYMIGEVPMKKKEKVETSTSLSLDKR